MWCIKALIGSKESSLRMCHTLMHFTDRRKVIALFTMCAHNIFYIHTHNIRHALQLSYIIFYSNGNETQQKKKKKSR